ncbi:hypothetical protein SAMN05720354_12437 [Nitrosospira sp. Nsp1]|nr:hypothetical protein SAMN05720354_12437 [Nitrosospira sp. Nsp1]
MLPADVAWINYSPSRHQNQMVFNPYSFRYAHMEFTTRYARLALVSVFVTLLAGCAGKPVIQTQVIEKQIAVPCRVETPPECKSAYAVDRTSAKDDAVTINRALRAEIEERWACEVKLLAAMKGCNKEMKKEGVMSAEKAEP